MASHPPHPALDRLALHRLQQNLSYDALAAVMADAGFPVKARALHLALTGRVAPLDRTLYRIERFVAYLDVAFAKKSTSRDHRTPVPQKRPRRRRAA